MKKIVIALTVLYCTLVVMIVSCAHQDKRVVLRDGQTYRAELEFLQLALHESNSLLVEHLDIGDCTCNAQGEWSSKLCEKTARHVLIVRTRVPYHVWMMLYNADMRAEPPLEIPDVGHPSELCPVSRPEVEDGHARI